LKFAGHVTVNAAAGAITGGFGTATQAAGRAVQITTMVTSSSLTSGASTIATNAIDGKKGLDVLDGVATAAIAGGVAGGISVGGKLVQEGKKITEIGSKIGLQGLIGASSGAASGATSSII
jgi:hypothetical protein